MSVTSECTNIILHPWSPDTSLGIAARQQTGQSDNRDSIKHLKKRSCSRSIQTPLSTGTKIKRPEREADHLHSASDSLHPMTFWHYDKAQTTNSMFIVGWTDGDAASLPAVGSITATDKSEVEVPVVNHVNQRPPFKLQS